LLSMVLENGKMVIMNIQSQEHHLILFKILYFNILFIIFFKNQFHFHSISFFFLF
jgi:hypothetical protein